MKYTSPLSLPLSLFSHSFALYLYPYITAYYWLLTGRVTRQLPLVCVCLEFKYMSFIKCI